MTTLHLPVQMANKAGCATLLECEGSTVGAVLNYAIDTFPSLANKIFATPGKINRFVRIFVDGAQCGAEIDEVPIASNSEIKILIAMAGG